jgi:hypothetical protein
MEEPHVKFFVWGYKFENGPRHEIGGPYESMEIAEREAEKARNTDWLNVVAGSLPSKPQRRSSGGGSHSSHSNRSMRRNNRK